MQEIRARVVWRILRKRGLDCDFEELKDLCQDKIPEDFSSIIKRKGFFIALWERVRRFKFWG